MKVRIFALFIFFFPLFIKTYSRKKIILISDYIEFSVNKEKLKRKTKKYKNKKFKKRKYYKPKYYALKGSHSKDSRYSNQQMLRRMYRNA